MEKMTVMGVGAHPDDLELLCGGTLARYAELGHKVVMAHLNNGDKGHYKLSCAEIAKIRKQEAENAGKIIGAEVVSPNFKVYGGNYGICRGMAINTFSA